MASITFEAVVEDVITITDLVTLEDHRLIYVQWKCDGRILDSKLFPNALLIESREN